MLKRHSLLSLFLCALLGVALVTPQTSHSGGGGGNAMAMVGKVLGGLLIMTGMAGLMRDIGQYQAAAAKEAAALPPAKPPHTAEKKKEMMEIAKDLLEIAGGAAAMMNNSGTEEQTRDQEGYMPDGLPPGGTSGGSTSGSSIPELCDSMPSACRKDPTTGRPNIVLPTREEMQALLSDSFNGKPVNDEGLTLEEALNDLDEKYDAASDAVAAFNAASGSGAFDDSGTGLAGTGQGNGDAGDGEGLNKGGGRGLAGSADAVTLPSGQTTDWASLLNKKKDERGPPRSAKAVGLNLEDGKTGRLLTLFERVTRTLRGTRDRDILLAKVEWTRKEALKKRSKKTPNVAVSTEKN